ncbi:MAG: translesion DNA synthesis-associated protein ImuA [Gammaproteobacteria bacterium]
MSDELENLIRSTPWLWRGDGSRVASSGWIPTGYPELDQILPGKGWPRGVVIEFLLKAIGIGELRLMLPAIRTLIAERRFIVMIDSPYRPYAPALSEAGVDLDALYLVVPDSPENAWWAAEKALLNPSCGMVLLWSDTVHRRMRGFLKDTVIRRLQVAAQATRAILLVYGIARDGGAERQNPRAALRLGLAGEGGALLIDVLKARGTLRHLRLRLNLENYG